MVVAEARRGQHDGGHHLVRRESIVLLRSVVRQAVKLRNRNTARSFGSFDLHLGLEGGQRDAHVRWMYGDAGVAGAEDRMDPVDTSDRTAARSGRPFVAGRRSIIKIVTARTLEEVAAGRGGVPKLRRRAGEDGTGKKRVAFDDLRMPGQVAVADQRADPQTSGFR